MANSSKHEPPILVCNPFAWHESTVIPPTYKQQVQEFHPWPINSSLTVKRMSTGNEFTDIVLKIMQKAVADWLSVLNGLRVVWVTGDGNADIRISFRDNEPNWSCIGTIAKSYSQDEPTMNFSFGKWKEEQAIFSHDRVARIASHLFGHAFGL